MKKFRSLSMVLALILALLAVPFGSFAEEAPVAQIGTTTYQSLNDAINEATEGQTVEVLRDCSTAGVTITKSITLKAKEGLDKKPLITATNNLIPDNGVMLTVENLSFYSGGKTIFQINNTCTLNLNNCDVESKGYYCVFFYGKAATLNIKGGNYRSNYSVIHFNGNNSPTDGMYVNIADKAILRSYGNLLAAANYAVISNPSGSSNIFVTIDDSTLLAERTVNDNVAEGACIKMKNAKNNHVVIKGGSILQSNFQYGIYMDGDSSCSLKIEDGTVEVAGVEENDANFNALGSTVSCIKTIGLNVELKKAVLNTLVDIEGKIQTAENSPFMSETVYAQLTKETTAQSESTNLRFVVQMNKDHGYQKMGFIVSVKNQTLYVGLDGAECTETDTLYDSIYANGVEVCAETDGKGWLAVGVDAIGSDAFDTEIFIRPYAYNENDRAYVLGDTYKLTVNELLAKTAASEAN